MLSSTFNLKNIDVKLGGKILCFWHAKTNAKVKKKFRENKTKFNAQIDFKGNENAFKYHFLRYLIYKYKRALMFIGIMGDRMAN